MEVSSIPYKFEYVWAESATAPTYLTTPIPATTASNVAASQALGFPPNTANPTGAPPNINDFNGAFQYLSQWTQWQQAGGPVFYDATFSGNIGGYPKGARIQVASNLTLEWTCTVDNNTSDPDTGGGGWISPSGLNGGNGASNSGGTISTNVTFTPPCKGVIGVNGNASSIGGTITNLTLAYANATDEGHGGSNWTNGAQTNIGVFTSSATTAGGVGVTITLTAAITGGTTSNANFVFFFYPTT